MNSKTYCTIKPRFTWIQEALFARSVASYFNPLLESLIPMLSQTEKRHHHKNLQILKSEQNIPVPSSDGGAEVAFVKSKKYSCGGETILEQAESLGMTVKSGCRMGICHSCTCRKKAGTVLNVVTGEVSGANEEEIQICISVPQGRVEIEL